MNQSSYQKYEAFLEPLLRGLVIQKQRILLFPSCFQFFWDTWIFHASFILSFILIIYCWNCAIDKFGTPFKPLSHYRHVFDINAFWASVKLPHDSSQFSLFKSDRQIFFFSFFFFQYFIHVIFISKLDFFRWYHSQHLGIVTTYIVFRQNLFLISTHKV